MCETVFIEKKQRLDRIQRHISGMPSLSPTVNKILEICNRPEPSADDLHRVISLDPVLMGQVFRLINSAWHSLYTPVTSLTRALILLGINTVKHLALGSAVLNVLSDPRYFRALRPEAFWTHSLLVAAGAKYLSASIVSDSEDSEEYFFSGLLHDLGKLPINRAFPEEYAALAATAEHDHMPLYTAEAAFFGFDHCHVGRLIAEKWKLTGHIAAAMSRHHEPAFEEEDTGRLTAVVALSDAFACMIADDLPDEHLTGSRQFPMLMRHSGLGRLPLPELRENVADELKKARIFLDIIQKG